MLLLGVEGQEDGNNFAALAVSSSPRYGSGHRMLPRLGSSRALGYIRTFFVSLLSCFCLYKNTFPLIHCVLWVKIHNLFLDFSRMCFVFEFSEWFLSHHLHLECMPGSAFSPSLSHSCIHSILTEQSLCLRYSAGSLVFRRDLVPDPEALVSVLLSPSMSALSQN